MFSIKEIRSGVYQFFSSEKEVAYLLYNSKFDNNYEEIGGTDKHYDFTLFTNPRNGNPYSSLIKIHAYKFLSKKFDRRYTYHIDTEAGYGKIQGIL